jgi:hypothetical protein
MSDQLEKHELQILRSLAANTATATMAGAYYRELETIVEKLDAGIVACDKREERIGSAQAEDFPATVDVETAEQYSELGQQLMLTAAGVRVPEGIHAKLCYLQVGLTSALCQVMKMEREPFCNNLVTNVMFSALKAAWCEGDNATSDTNRGPTPE